MNKKGVWRLSPAYDMTYIFDNGGYLPNKDHCLMIGGKYRDISYDDVLSFANECGIRNAKCIIKDVVAAVASFRELALKNKVRDEWIGRIEKCLTDHLVYWGFAAEESISSFDIDGHIVTDAHIEIAYKGNYHLLANIDGKRYKYILREGKTEHNDITQKGLSQLTIEDMKALVRKYLLQ